jgi:hypothetical protein
MRVILEAIDGPHKKKRFVLPSHAKAIFGRTEWSDYQFPDDPLISSKHFSVECIGRTCVLRDLGSTNGTYVDDERIVEREVITGSIIRAGNTKIKVTLDIVHAAPPLPAPPPPKLPPDNVVRTKIDVNQSDEAPQGRAANFAPPRQSSFISSDLHQQALADADPVVRRNALLAAAWAGRKWVLNTCRNVPLDPDNWEAHLLLAILGQPADLARILVIGRSEALGSRRWQALGAFGHPEVVNDLIAAMESLDANAAAAGAAFKKITGVDVTASGTTASAPSSSAPTSDDEPLEELALPDSAVAAREWRKLKGKFAAGQRWAGGFEVSSGLPEGAAEKLDLEARFEACLRGRFAGSWSTSRFDLEQLANKLSS